MNLKRSLWTNAEVITMLKDFLHSSSNFGKGVDPEVVQGYLNYGNDVIDRAISQFEDFQRPEEQPGALAMDTDTGVIYHVGARLPR